MELRHHSEYINNDLNLSTVYSLSMLMQSTSISDNRLIH